ncbi:MAG: DUF3261 domain-containing protein [Terricaulis sp.]
MRARISESITLNLPTPPAYPETQTLSQIIRGRYGETERAFECIVSLSPESVEIVVTTPGGPRLATIIWSATGVEERRTALAPQGVPVENILADLFVARWPGEAITESLPTGVTFSDIDGVRTLAGPDGLLVDVTPDAADPTRVTLRNRAFGYELTIVSRVIG